MTEPQRPRTATVGTAGSALPPPVPDVHNARGVRWAKVIDQTRCIGCHACTTACKSENQVPVSVTRTYVKYVEIGLFPQTRRAFQINRCNHCEHAPCVAACPTSAMYKRDDGIVDFDKRACIGCKACIAACPYDAIFINPADHSAEKCNFCAHRVDAGLAPACVVVCPTSAIVVGDLNDPASDVSHLVYRDTVAVRRPEKDTRPLLFYKGAHAATLDSLAARRPDGGLFLWSEQRTGSGFVVSGATRSGNTSAAALLAYDVPHRMPWDWRVSLYTWTKSIAAGVYLVAAVLVLAGVLDASGGLWRWGVPVAGGAFLAATGALLVADLEHPERFHFIFLRPQWRSWLVRGAFVIACYSAVLALHFTGSLLGWRAGLLWLTALGLPAATCAAAYTAYLFAQAKARDLWQNPLLPAHFVVQGALAGGASLLLLAAWIEPRSVGPLSWTVAVAALLDVLMVAGEVTLPHVTAHARAAVREMTRGRFRHYFWTGLALGAASVLTPLIGVAGALLGLAGLIAHEHAYVQAGQAVPLA